MGFPDAEALFTASREAAIAAYRAPRATYRLQFHAGFGFRDAIAILPYLRDLGIDTVYASPLLRAQPESSHGYDIVDHQRINPTLGSDEDYQAYAAALARHGLSQIVDTVPNHVGIARGNNAWWNDVLEHGPAARYARAFDIDWTPARPEMKNRVLLPILGDSYGTVLERGELRLAFDDGRFGIHYYEHRLPVAPRTAAMVIDQAIHLMTDGPAALELRSIHTALKNLPPREAADPDSVEERYRETAIARSRLERLMRHRTAKAAITAAIDRINGDPADPASFDLLDRLLDAQPYRLAFWRVAAEEINYRRFFDINDLAAIKMEDSAVFEDTHRLLFDLIAKGSVTGLRIDHPDGLWDPGGYFWQLQRTRFAQLAEGLAGDRWPDLRDGLLARYDREVARSPRTPGLRPLYLAAEKIVEPSERMPNVWPIDGTTGYDFLNEVNGLFVDRRHHRAMDRIYREFAGPQPDIHDLVNASKKQIMLVSLASEVEVLSQQLAELAGRNRRTRDITHNTLTFALREVIAAMSVYRTYIAPETGEVSGRDRAVVEAAVAEAKRRNPRTEPSVFEVVGDTLLLRDSGLSDLDREDRARWVRKFQQVSGPVMAKGVEDTAFYINMRLISLNEVGGDPAAFGMSVADFHRRQQQRHRRYPAAMLTLSTHDTKRSEDVRARVSILSEMPDAWAAAVRRWRAMNASKRPIADGRRAPDRNDEYLIYQTLIGILPANGDLAGVADRLGAYLTKATREAKVRTSWVAPNEAYERAIDRFIRALFEDAAFLADLRAFQTPIVRAGLINSLAQTLILITAPGIPDCYQGAEWIDLSLVDPDNRRPVDYALRERALATLKKRADDSALAADLLTAGDGMAKLFVGWRARDHRRDKPDRFVQGEYQPLTPTGDRRRNAVAFARVHEGASITIAPRLVTGLADPPIGDAWGDTSISIPARWGRLRNVLTGTRLPAGRILLRDALGTFPVALLTTED